MTLEIIDVVELMTLERFNQLTPYEQGYVWYMQAELDGSELPKECPYPEKSKEYTRWNSGANVAMFSVLDGDDE